MNAAYLIGFCCFAVYLNVTSINAFRFVTNPENPNSHFIGYIWKHAGAVHISPKLQARPDTAKSKLCCVAVYPVNNSVKLNAEVVDPVEGFINLLIATESLEDFEENTALLYDLEAFDYEQSSDKTSITIHVIIDEGPFFTQPSYTFSTSERSHIGSVIGWVGAIEQARTDEPAMTSAICNYTIQPQTVPFNVDKSGSIRVQEKLQTRLNNQPYAFRVVVQDCHRPVPRSSYADVMVRVIRDGCQPGWNELPKLIEVKGTEDRPYNLLHSYKFNLETCQGSCPNVTVQTRLELLSAVHESTLKTAYPGACFRDPEHLSRQRKLCDIHPHTLINLLPDPDVDIAQQIVGNQHGGNQPRLKAPAQTWKFSEARKSVWAVDPDILDTPKHGNAFDSEFTLAFWLRRQAKFLDGYDEDREETVLCSQDSQEKTWRLMSVSFRGCRLIVRFMASLRDQEADVLDDEVRELTEWDFGVLPTDICSTAVSDADVWHYYAITFERRPWSVTSKVVSLLVDGQNRPFHDNISKKTHSTDPPFQPLTAKANPKITIGACYDPLTHLTKQHLNGELAGFTLLMGRAESPSNIRCVALCGETLIVPNLLKYLRADVNVNLESNAVTIMGTNLSHVETILRAIAYIRPQSTPGSITHPLTQSRSLNLSTLYRCAQSDGVVIPSSLIELDVLPAVQSHVVETGHVIGTDTDNSFERPPIGQREMEERAAAVGHDQTSLSPPVLIIEGSNTIITEPPILEPGIQLFGDIHFENPGGDDDIHERPVAVPLDSCLVWVLSSGEPKNLSTSPSLNELEDEHIDWSVDKVVSLGLSGKNDKNGIRLSGRFSAGDYENVLKSFYYWPPRSFRATESDLAEVEKIMNGNKIIAYMATFGLVCATESGKQSTSQFLVKVIIESANQVELDPEDYDAPVQSIYVQSNDERHKFGAPGLLNPNGRQLYPGQMKESDLMSPKSPLTAVGIAVTAVLVFVLACASVAVYVRRTSPRFPLKPPSINHRSGRGRFSRQPASFGGENLKRDPTLRLTANPRGEMEFHGLGTVREDLSGSASDLTAKNYLFSSPVDHRLNSNNLTHFNARLAGLDEFDELIDQVTDDENFSDGCTSIFYHGPRPMTDASPQPVVKQNVEREPHSIQVHHSETDPIWIDEDRNESADLARPQKWDIVAHCAVDEDGPPAATV